MKNILLWDVILCSLVEINVFGKNNCVILTVKAVHSSETLVHFYWSTEHYIPQDSSLHNHLLPELHTSHILFLCRVYKCRHLAPKK